MRAILGELVSGAPADAFPEVSDLLSEFGPDGALGEAL